jgi:hypothetical protein
MKVKIRLTLNVNQVLDLTDYGYDEDVKWSDLSEDDQNEITDALRDENVANLSVEEMDEY